LSFWVKKKKIMSFFLNTSWTENPQSFLSTLPLGSKCPSSNPGKCWCHVEKGVVKEITFDTTQSATGTDFEAIVREIENMIKMFPQLHSFAMPQGRLLPILLAGVGAQFDINVQGGTPVAFTISDRSSNSGYFDSQMAGDIHGDFSSGACYRSTAPFGFENMTVTGNHLFRTSGDEDSSNFLLHRIFINTELLKKNNSSNVKGVFQVTGYNGRTLESLKSQNPKVMIFASDAIVVYIPSLSVASVGMENRFACLAVCETVSDTKLKMCFIDPVLSTKGTTGNYNPDNICHAALEASKPFSKKNFDAQPIANDPFSKALQRGKSLGGVSKGKAVMPNFVAQHIVLLQASLENPFAEENFCILGFGKRLFPWEERKEDDKVQAFPVMVDLCGPAILSQCGFSQVRFFKERVQMAKSIWVFGDAKRKTPDEMIFAHQERLNAIFVLQNPDMSSMTDEEARNASINFAACAGPLSFLLFRDGNMLKWMRGPCNIEPMRGIMPEFGADVTALFGFKDLHLPCPHLINVSDDQVWFRNTMMPAPQALEKANAQDTSGDILSLLVQVSVVCSSDVLNKAKLELFKRFSQTDPRLIEAQAELKTLLIEKASPAQIKHALDKVKSVQKSQNKTIANAIQTLSSTSGVTSIKSGLRQMLRAAQVTANIDAAKNATIQDFVDLIENDCSQLGVVMFQINGENVLDYIRSSLQNGNLVEINDRCMHLDAAPSSMVRGGGEDGWDIIKWKESKNSYTFHPFELPQAMMLLPLLDMFKDCKTPNYDLKIMECCNSSPVSMWRISMCTMLSERSGVEPTSEMLSLALIKMIFGVLDAITINLSDAPQDFDNTIAQICRCLYLLVVVTLARGKMRPLCPLFELFQRKNLDANVEFTQAPASQLWILEGLVKYARFTGMEMKYFEENLRVYLVGTVRKVSLLLTKPLMAAKTQNAQVSMTESLEKTNEMLQYTYLLCQTSKALLSGKIENVSLTAQKLVQYAPDFIKRKSGTFLLHQRFLKLCTHPFISEKEKNEMALTVANLMTKRGSVFRILKTEFLEAMKGGELESFKDLFWKKVNETKSEILVHAVTESEISVHTEKVKMQNTEAYVNAEMGKIRGDAELFKGMWSVTGQEVDTDLLDSRVANILGFPLNLESSLQTAKENLEIKPASMSALEIKFKGTVLEETAKVIAEDLPLSFWNHLGNDESHYAMICAKVSAHAPRELFKNLLTTHLLHWDTTPCSSSEIFKSYF
jgi:hypothetical protein